MSVSKKADLLKLCTSGIIKSKCHDFYKNLLTSDTTQDRLPEPDCTDELLLDTE